MFAFVDYEDEEIDENFAVKVMNRCARDVKASNSGGSNIGKSSFLVG